MRSDAAASTAAPDATQAGSERRLVRVWDVPTRLFHWLLVAAFAAQWFTQDDARLLDFHVFAGYTIGVLLLFRLLWGFAGTRYARFGSFLYAPRVALGHLRGTLAGKHDRYVGHNPAGAWSIFLMLILGAATVITGLIAFGGAKQLGPLRGLVGFARGDTFALIHKYLAWTMLALVAMHVLGVLLASRAEHENLALSMVAGTKRATATFEGVPAAATVAFVLLVVAASAAWLYFRGYFGAANPPYVPFTLATPLVQNATWTKECGGCHVAYHPSTLPARSWSALLKGQQDHFGEDLALDENTVAELAAYADAQAAATHATPLAWKIDHTTPAAEAPLRITDTPYWKHRHADVADADWEQTKRFACDGCHLDAAAGAFLPGAIKVGAAAPAAPTAGKAR